MFVRRLVRRSSQLVRCVGDELALGAGRFLERAEHRVEAARERAQLVLTACIHTFAQISGLGDLAGRIREPPDRRERSPGNEVPEAERNRNSAGVDQK